MPAKLRRWLLGWLLLSVAFAALALWQARHSFADSLAQQLQRQLPPRLNEALQNRFRETELFGLVREKLNRDLQALPARGTLPLLNQCRAQVERLVAEPDAPGGDIVLSWRLGERPQRTTLDLACDVHWPLLLGSQSLLALLVVIAFALLPQPLSATRRMRIGEWRDFGLSARRAAAVAKRLEDLNPVQAALFAQLQVDSRAAPEALLDWLAREPVATLTPEQLPWFVRARDADAGDADACLAIARAPAEIDFDCSTCRVTVHGIAIPLSKTPFFYFLWYAQLRRDGDGWLLNPPVNRPDRRGAVPLAELMERCGGHNKAINDLRENGLRAKTLDQNRNKIKDELSAALGEKLAADYLFEAERDLPSGRYCYRLRTAAAHIAISAAAMDSVSG